MHWPFVQQHLWWRTSTETLRGTRTDSALRNALNGDSELDFRVEANDPTLAMKLVRRESQRVFGLIDTVPFVNPALPVLTLRRETMAIQRVLNTAIENAKDTASCSGPQQVVRIDALCAEMQEAMGKVKRFVDRIQSSWAIGRHYLESSLADARESLDHIDALRRRTESEPIPGDERSTDVDVRALEASVASLLRCINGASKQRETSRIQTGVVWDLFDTNVKDPFMADVAPSVPLMCSTARCGGAENVRRYFQEICDAVTEATAHVVSISAMWSPTFRCSNAEAFVATVAAFAQRQLSTILATGACDTVSAPRCFISAQGMMEDAVGLSNSNIGGGSTTSLDEQPSEVVKRLLAELTDFERTVVDPWPKRCDAVSDAIAAFRLSIATIAFDESRSSPPAAAAAYDVSNNERATTCEMGLMTSFVDVAQPAFDRVNTLVDSSSMTDTVSVVDEAVEAIAAVASCSIMTLPMGSRFGLVSTATQCDVSSVDPAITLGGSPTPQPAASSADVDDDGSPRSRLERALKYLALEQQRKGATVTDRAVQTSAVSADEEEDRPPLFPPTSLAFTPDRPRAPSCETSVLEGIDVTAELREAARATAATLDVSPQVRERAVGVLKSDVESYRDSLLVLRSDISRSAGQRVEVEAQLEASKAREMELLRILDRYHAQLRMAKGGEKEALTTALQKVNDDLRARCTMLACRIDELESQNLAMSARLGGVLNDAQILAAITQQRELAERHAASRYNVLGALGAVPPQVSATQLMSPTKEIAFSTVAGSGTAASPGQAAQSPQSSSRVVTGAANATTAPAPVASAGAPPKTVRFEDQQPSIKSTLPPDVGRLLAGSPKKPSAAIPASPVHVTPPSTSSAVTANPVKESVTSATITSASTPAAAATEPAKPQTPARVSDTRPSQQQATTKGPAPVAGPAPDAVALPPGWKSMVDAKSGRTYYYNTKSKETSWKPPT